MSDRPLSLLYAEDDPKARELLAKLIRRKFPGLTVYEAADGEEGMAIFNRYHPDLILTDITMPVLDGVEMAKQIRKINPDAVVMALTAHNDEEMLCQWDDLKFDQCISKPIQFGPLLDAVDHAIKDIVKH